jgi:hypothetical protein
VRDGIIVSLLTSAAKRLLSPHSRPGSLDHFGYKEHYGTDEEFVYALA